jgi:adenine deaminase
MKPFSIIANLVDVHQKRIYPAEIVIEKERIVSITEKPAMKPIHFILPGFIDAHVHIESSMLVPSEFAKLAVVHGTVATVSDPHEIANVCGVKGVEFMIENGKTVPFKFNFGAPSCVPATIFETAGDAIDAKAIDDLLKRTEILYLAEMMNFPGVLHGDEEVLAKIAAAKKYNKPIDGHAPGLRGDAAKQYIDAGISTDHECFTAEEALDKLQHGMKILIREGSAAKNFEALADLMNDHADNMMFCSDDKHPDSLAEGHINLLCKRAIAKGIDIFKVLQAACVNPVNHYKLKVGLLRQNDFADFIIVKDLRDFDVIQTYINGALVADKKKATFKTKTLSEVSVPNKFHCEPITPEQIIFPFKGDKQIAVIGALDGQLITEKIMVRADELLKNTTGGNVPDSKVEIDVLKMVVVNRYQPAPVAVAFIKNTGLKHGAFASSVAHDSHNIVAVGTNDEAICRAVNAVIKYKGGISTVDNNGREKILPLPVAGLMSVDDGTTVALSYSALDATVKQMGSTLTSPFMTLSFMALLVIPHLKLSDKGLFDGDRFEFVNAD